MQIIRWSLRCAPAALMIFLLFTVFKSQPTVVSSAVSEGNAALHPLDRPSAPRKFAQRGSSEFSSPVFRQQSGDKRVYRTMVGVSPRSPILEIPVRTADDDGLSIKDDDLVLGVEINGQSRAYPITQLCGPNREIINDQIGGRAIAATW